MDPELPLQVYAMTTDVSKKTAASISPNLTRAGTLTLSPSISYAATHRRNAATSCDSHVDPAIRACSVAASTAA